MGWATMDGGVCSTENFVTLRPSRNSLSWLIFVVSFIPRIQVVNAIIFRIWRVRVFSRGCHVVPSSTSQNHLSDACRKCVTTNSTTPSWWIQANGEKRVRWVWRLCVTTKNGSVCNWDTKLYLRIGIWKMVWSRTLSSRDGVARVKICFLLFVVLLFFRCGFDFSRFPSRLFPRLALRLLPHALSLLQHGYSSHNYNVGMFLQRTIVSCNQKGMYRSTFTLSCCSLSSSCLCLSCSFCLSKACLSRSARSLFRLQWQRKNREF